MGRSSNLGRVEPITDQLNQTKKQFLKKKLSRTKLNVHYRTDFYCISLVRRR